MTEERYLYQQINMLKLQYEALIQPYLDRLVAIKSMELKPSFTVLRTDIDPELLEKLTR